MAELYKLDFASGKSYIGVTHKTSQARYGGHAWSSFKGGHYLIHRAWRKYGAPKLKVLAVVEDHMLEDSERRAVEVFGTLHPGGYNMIPGGELTPSYARIGKKHSKKSRLQMSESAKHRVISEESIKSRSEKLSKAHTGRKHTKKARRNMSKAQKIAKKVFCNTPEGKKLMSKIRKGVKFTDEQKANLSLIRMGHPTSEATKKKIAISHLGMKHSKATLKKMGAWVRTEATCAKISKSKKGQKHTEKTKRKMSKSHKQRNKQAKK